MTYAPLDVATVYAATFAARTDVYSHWVAALDPETQKPVGWRPVRSPLTPELVLNGLKGQGPSLSGFLIAPGSVSHVMALDFDGDHGLDQAGALGRFMWSDAIPAYVETSRRGAHLWCVLDHQLPAVAIRHAIRALLQGAGLPPSDPKIELRPGSDTISDDGLGHALRLPLMPHPKTGQRGAMTDPRTSQPVGRTMAEILLNIEWASAERLHPRWSERWRPPVTHFPRDFRNPHSYPDEEGTASSILRDLWGVQNARPGRSVKCPAHPDRVASLLVFGDDLRAECYAPSCILNNDGRGRGTWELRKLANEHGPARGLAENNPLRTT